MGVDTRRGGTVVRAVRSGDEQALRALHSALFPVVYPDAFYQHALSARPAALARVATVRGVLAGAVVCRADSLRRLYIVTLGVLAPYREGGLGTALLQHACNGAAEAIGATLVYAHVQEGNEAALRLYARNGFTVRERVLNYYRRITPRHALVVEKSSGVE